jgi:hypothetical protein
MNSTGFPGAVRAALVIAAALFALSAPRPGVVHAQAPDTLPSIIAATALPLASPTGAADIGLVIHWLDTERPELYGFALRTQSRRMPLHVQLGYGQPRGPIGGRWLLGLSVDGGPRLVQRPAASLGGVVGAQLLYDRQREELSVRLPLGVRGETTFALAEAVSVTPLAAGGAGLGFTRLDDWTGYGGVFGEAGLRITIAGFWVQGGVGLDHRLLGEPQGGGDARFVVRLGYIPAGTGS